MSNNFNKTESSGEPLVMSEEKSRKKGSVEFIIKIQDLPEINKRVVSKPCIIYGIPWRIHVPCKNELIDGVKVKCLGYYIHCNEDSDSSLWSCKARVNYKLLSHDHKPKSFLFKNRLYYEKSKSWGFPQFIKWDEVLDPINGYIKNNQVTFEAYIEPEEPHGISWQLDSRSEFIFTFDVPKFSTLTEFDSASFFVRNLPWKVKLEAYTDETSTKWLSIYLECVRDKDTSSKNSEWSCFTKFYLAVNSEDECNKKREEIVHTFSNDSSVKGCQTFIKWDEIINTANEYLTDDEISIEVEVVADEPHGISKIHDLLRRECTFTHEVELLSKDHNKPFIISPVFYVCNLPWKFLVKLCTKISDNGNSEKWLSFFIECYATSESWSCNATTELKIENAAHDQLSIKRTCNEMFSKKNTKGGVAHLIKYNYITNPENGYLFDEDAKKIKISVHLKADTPHGLSHIYDARAETNLLFKFQDVCLITERKTSAPFFVRNMLWRIVIIPFKENKDKYLAVYLFCAGEAKNSIWSCQAKAEINLISTKYLKTIIKEINHNFSSKQDEMGFNKFVTWDDLINPENEFTVNDRISLSVNLKADEPKFLEMSKFT